MIETKWTSTRRWTKTEASKVSKV